MDKGTGKGTDIKDERMNAETCENMGRVLGTTVRNGCGYVHECWHGHENRHMHTGTVWGRLITDEDMDAMHMGMYVARSKDKDMRMDTRRSLHRCGLMLRRQGHKLHGR